MALSVMSGVLSLDTTLQRLTALSPYLEGRTGADLPEGWIASTDLFAPGSPSLPLVLDAVGATTGSDDWQIAVSFFMNGYAWTVAAVALGCVVVDGRLPDLSFENVALHYDDGRMLGVAFMNGRFTALPDDAAAGDPHADLVPDRAALLESFRQQIEAHMARVVPVLRAQSSLGTRALWITVADRCAGFLYWANQLKPDLLPREAVLADLPALIQVPGSPMANKLTRIEDTCAADGSTLTLRRGSCCLNYRRPGGDLCESCPLNKD
ncbi:MAG TPA: IucA/IucC family C-terminal-domain containing protein [Aggregatilinea sp.]|uniref:IucA/IucC family C-terminal-domain containing protein n=1 Tax=Aggregatilinea sp. TaxID=2806333 RepID=UPI002CC0FE80|nr:IucA/IucC family C-terminal-domain containing protein [Aggregatilinea sp.]HML23437.1 IucA/IucC family C-terminal-domain containing protein [Aggregatilinea sp.]